ncbi:MAG: BatA domain-containing protein [Planctomycetota bacterium]
MDCFSFPLMFAFGFASSWLLWGLFLGALPPLIHLLNRRRFRETQWAAMRFLAEAVRKNSRRMRIEQLILLLVRIAIVTFLVLGLAQPQLQTLGRLFTTNVPTHRILLMDTSFSMGFQGTAITRFQQSQEIARRIVESARQGDAFNLVRICGSEPRVIVRKPAFQTDEVLQEIERLELPDERGEIHPALLEIDKLLQGLPEIPQKEVVIISDLQQSCWQPDSAGKPTEIRALLKKIGAASRLVLVDVGQGGQENHALTDLRAQDDFHTVKQPARFKVSATTFSRMTSEAELEFFVDGKLQATRTLNLQPLTEVSEDFAYTFATGGDHLIQARLSKDGLPVDDQRQLVVRVKEQLRVLCVNGKLAGRAKDTATFHLQLALAPNPQDSAATALIQPQVIKYGELRGFDLSQYDCVFLCNVSSLDVSEAQLLETFLKGGGAVVWCLGDRVDAASYNRILFKDGQGILPAEILERHGNASESQVEQKTAFGFDPLEFQHPILKVFQGNPEAGLERTQTYEYFRTKLAARNPGRVALAFSSGDPAIIETRVGAGKSILITTALDQSWGNWAVWPSFLPLIQELVFYAVSAEGSRDELLVGEPWQRTLQTRGADVAATVTRPDGEVEPARSSPNANLTDFHYDRTDRSGVYQLQLGPPLNRKESFVVNVDPRESNLTRVERDEIERDLLAGTDFRYLTDWADLDRQATRTAAESGDLSRVFLYLVLYLLFVEQLLAWNFNAGLWLLCPPLAAWRRWRGMPR